MTWLTWFFVDRGLYRTEADDSSNGTDIARQEGFGFDRVANHQLIETTYTCSTCPPLTC